jgi:hypothetical protein
LNENLDLNTNINNISYKNIEYELEIQRLKKQYNSLKFRNKFLLTKLDDLIKSNTLLEEDINTNILDKYGINDLINDYSFSNNNLNSFEKINEIYMICEDLNLKNELINGLKTLYILKNNEFQIGKNEELNIKIIWRWIKNLIENIKNTNEEVNNFKIGLEHLKEEKQIFKDFCLDLMEKFNIEDIEELKNQINSLIINRNIEKKRINKLKKVLTGK